MINVTELEPSQYRGALAAHYTIDNNGLILNDGPWNLRSYWHLWFADWATKPIEESGAEQDGTIFTFYLFSEEQEVFGLPKNTKAVHFNSGDLSVTVEEFPVE